MIPPTLLANASDNAITGVIIFLFGLALAIVWVIFPFLVMSKFNTLILLQKETNRLLKAITEVKPPPVPPGVYKLD